MKKYVENIEEYEEICQYIGFGTPISIWAFFRAPPSYNFWDLKKFRIHPLYMGLVLGKIPRPSFLLGSGTWKNFDLHPYIYTYTEIDSGTWKNSELYLYTGSGI